MKKFNFRLNTEKNFLKVLREVARNFQKILGKYLDKNSGEIKDLAGFLNACEKYSIKLEPWAERECQKILKRVDAQNAADWRATAPFLQSEILAQIGAVEAKDLLLEQVALIKSLPLDAAQKAQALAAEAMLGGERAAAIVGRLLDLGAATEARAMLIARTEIAKANATFTRARSDAAGVTHYVWRTVGDEKVRSAHEALDGEIFAFAEPPDVEGEGRHHPGEFPNCRCYAEPIILNESLNESK